MVSVEISLQLRVRPLQEEDIDTTNKITQALKYVSVRVLDHIIVGRARQDYFSFARAGMV